MGAKDSDTFTFLLDKAYEEAVHWRQNPFDVPRGKVGAEFGREVSGLIEAYNDATDLESTAVKAVTLMALPGLHASTEASSQVKHQGS